MDTATPSHQHDHVHDDHHENWLSHLFGGHSHGAAHMDVGLAGNDKGIWAVKVSLVVLLVTSGLQLAVVLSSGSVALLADMIHNFSDALTAIPLFLAFQLGKRLPTKRYAYGYGRAEDLAGAVVVLMIFASALVVFYESVEKLIHPQPVSNLLWVMVAAIIGFLGNEAVAIFRIRTGREIGSAALEADGVHARTDGLTSLSVLIGALGVALGFPLADPLIGLLIGVVVLFVTRDAAREMWYRLMDATDPELCNQVEHIAAHTAGVLAVHDVFVRWLGHRLRGEMYVEVNADLPTFESHQIAEQVRHSTFDKFPMFDELTVHIEPCNHHGDPHALTAHHERVTSDKMRNAVK